MSLNDCFRSISDDREPIFVYAPVRGWKERIAATRSLQQWQSSTTGTGDNVQMMRAVSAMQAAGHGKSHGIGSICARLTKNARTRHPQFLNGKDRKQSSEAWTTRPLS
jgi:hypothetical protein